jgi:hypothetical protein
MVRLRLFRKTRERVRVAIAMDVPRTGNAAARMADAHAA